MKGTVAALPPRIPALAIQEGYGLRTMNIVSESDARENGINDVLKLPSQMLAYSPHFLAAAFKGRGALIKRA
jgi:hypothetical protein